MQDLTNEDRRLMIEEAMGLLEDAIDLVTEAVAGTRHEAHAKAYTLPHMEMLTWRETGWLGKNPGNLESLRDAFEEEEEDEE